eukprot:scaffold243294_cov30-Tisochrysis_lutea.AAC.3
MHERTLRLGMPLFNREGPELQESRACEKMSLASLAEKRKPAEEEGTERMNEWDSSDEDEPTARADSNHIGSHSVQLRRRVPPAALGKAICSAGMGGDSDTQSVTSTEASAREGRSLMGRQRMPLSASSGGMLMRRHAAAGGGKL